MPTLVRFALAGAVIAVATPAFVPAATSAPKAVAVVLTTGSGSGPIGTAIFTQKPSGVVVTVKFAIRQPVNGTAAIYKGDCTSPGAGPLAYKLNRVVEGNSQTTLPRVSLRTLTSGRYVVVLHYLPTSLCGDLRAAKPVST
ncbi:MAG TPA: hypothetical protein VE591_06870 [Candidatus Acidoferrum sp.]|jgi:hypothetical protein|nr:hypothetical protein [Candidatus Acidoferrum sp.]